MSEETLIQSQQVTLTVPVKRMREVLRELKLIASYHGVTVTLTPTSVTDATVGVTRESQQKSRRHKRKADFKHAEDCSCFGDVVEHSRDCKNCTCQTED